MNKLFNKAVLNGTTVMGDGLTYPRIPNVYTGDNEGGYQRGDMMDANAVVEMIKELTDTGKITIEELQNLINEEIQERVEGDQDQQRYTDEKIKDLIGTSPETLDTLKEIADALGEDPDFAANVWNKIAELTTKHDADIQELQDAITSGFENIDFTSYVKKTDVVTDTTNGLMLASDKTKLDIIPKYVLANNDNHLLKIFQYDYDVIIRTHLIYLPNGESLNTDYSISSADQSRAGVMSASDKRKLDSLENYTLPAATETTLGGVKLHSIIEVPGHTISNALGINSEGKLGLAYFLRYDRDSKQLILEYANGTKGVSDIASTIYCFDFIQDGPTASFSKNGLMSREDKIKLDSQPTIKANDATGVTDDDYVVIKKSEYQSILDRLSALENNA